VIKYGGENGRVWWQTNTKFGKNHERMNIYTWMVGYRAAAAAVLLLLLLLL
jgi:hypothetical protein